MSFVLKDKRSGAYLASGGSWTSELDHAVVFPSGVALLNHVRESVPAPESELEIVILEGENSCFSLHAAGA